MEEDDTAGATQASMSATQAPFSQVNFHQPQQERLATRRRYRNLRDDVLGMPSMKSTKPPLFQNGRQSADRRSDWFLTSRTSFCHTENRQDLLEPTAANRERLMQALAEADRHFESGSYFASL